MNRKLGSYFPLFWAVWKDFARVAWENSRTKCIGIIKFERHVASQTEERRHKRRAGLLTFSSVSDCPLACPNCERVCHTYIGFHSNRKHCSERRTLSALLHGFPGSMDAYQRIMLITMAFRLRLGLVVSLEK